ncbi:hypothetical protein [Moorena sp. SIO3I6]|uniref:hypothetical protein n=1 Tax=Moorena sp. SIO3I6 TaxID=2607831 RepID=UPI0013F75CAF|nr:hypothetical protein [Moorena sp. SIO3I6]NEP23554.1 hypothetical protein [Moorena sp. SIO3I6]
MLMFVGFKKHYTAFFITIRYTAFFHSCLLPLASCLFRLTSSLLPAPCSLKPRTKAPQTSLRIATYSTLYYKPHYS